MPSLSSYLLSALLASTALAGPVAKRIPPRNNYTNPLADNAAIIAALENAPTAIDRFSLLRNPSDFVFDFQNAGASSITMGKGSSFPLLLALATLFTR